MAAVLGNCCQANLRTPQRHIANVPGLNPERAHLVCLLMHKQLKVIVCPVQIGHGTALYASMVASPSKTTGVLFQ